MTKKKMYNCEYHGDNGIYSGVIIKAKSIDEACMKLFKIWLDGDSSISDCFDNEFKFKIEELDEAQ